MLYSLIMENDILSDTLMKMKLKSSLAGSFDIGGEEWAIEFPTFEEGIKLQVIQTGECWVAVEGQREPYRLQKGDCFLTTGHKGFVAARTPALLTRGKRLPIRELLTKSQPGVLLHQGGGDLFSLGVMFQFDGHLPGMLFKHIPPAIHIPAHLEQAGILRRSVEQFRQEFLSQHLGRTLILNHLAPIILLQILRLNSSATPTENNWLAALADARLSRALAAMHTDYQRPWTLEALAAVAGLSRSGFALNFKKQVGIAPMDYLANWRMQMACERLQAGETIAAVAHAVGYASESAFSVAFNKIVKCRPGYYKKQFVAWPAERQAVS